MAQASEQVEPIQYNISFVDSPRHLIDIEAVFPTDDKESIELMMPVWTPGSYLVREYARQVETIGAFKIGSPESLPLTKLGKNLWSVKCQGEKQVVIRYRLYCHEMSVRTNWVEERWGLLTGAATFITRADAVHREHFVRLLLPPNWPKVACSLEKITDATGTLLKAKNFDQLVDSPIVMGDLDDQTFTVNGVVHHLVNVPNEPLWKSAEVIGDLEKIVAQQNAFWKETPYREYWFLNVLAEAGGGLEHDDSTVLMASRWTKKKRESYVNWLGLASHEFFHVWNVRRLRPATLKTYDYQSEQYFSELWIAEGITSYYDDLFVRRAGLSSREEYLDRLSKTISGLETTPGRQVQSLADSSWDAWIKHYRPDENAHNSRVSYYVKGAVVAALLDAELRLATNGESSLDDVMRALWNERLSTGYTLDDFEAIASRIAKKDMKPWFDKVIRTSTDLDYQPLLNCYGMRFKSSGDKSKPAEVSLGADAADTAGKLIVKRIIRGGSADQAGIGVDDELLALDNYRIGGENLTDRLSHYQVGDEVTFLTARRGKLSEVKVRLQAKPTTNWQLELNPEASEQQKEELTRWLALPKDEKVETSSKQ